jgi:hypothetical protein
VRVGEMGSPDQIGSPAKARVDGGRVVGWADGANGESCPCYLPLRTLCRTDTKKAPAG